MNNDFSNVLRLICDIHYTALICKQFSSTFTRIETTALEIIGIGSSIFPRIFTYRTALLLD
jgi:hypothetical protein